MTISVQPGRRMALTTARVTHSMRIAANSARAHGINTCVGASICPGFWWTVVSKVGSCILQGFGCCWLLQQIPQKAVCLVLYLLSGLVLDGYSLCLFLKFWGLLFRFGLRLWRISVKDRVDNLQRNCTQSIDSLLAFLCRVCRCAEPDCAYKRSLSQAPWCSMIQD